MSASKVGDALIALYQRDGSLTASGVVAEARDEASPLHPCFEWDDTEAAHQYRLDQARVLMRTVRITYDGEQTRLVHVPSITRGEGEYRPLSVIVERPDELRLALGELRRNCRGLLRTIEMVVDAAGDRIGADLTAALGALSAEAETLMGAIETHTNGGDGAVQ